VRRLLATGGQWFQGQRRQAFGFCRGQQRSTHRGFADTGIGTGNEKCLCHFLTPEQ